MFITGWIIALSLWWLLAVPRLRKGPTGRAAVGLLWRVSNAWVRWRHRCVVEGHDHLTELLDEPLIIIANHTGGIDPLLIQSASSRIIRWMMARDMMGNRMEDFWDLVEVIPVDREGVDAAALRTALRTLRGGGHIGVFPEGRITRPPGTIRPFHEGVGMLAARTGANVLPCWISGTPDVDSLAGSLLRRSSSRVKVLEPVQYRRDDRPADIAADLRRRLAEASGWPLCDEAMPLVLPARP